jgi:hypothetical protein
MILVFRNVNDALLRDGVCPGRNPGKILEDTNTSLDESQVIHWMMQVCEALVIFIATPLSCVILNLGI